MERLLEFAGGSQESFEELVSLYINQTRQQLTEIAEAMFDAVRSLQDADASELDENDIRDDALQHVPHFLDEAWTWRR